MTSIHLIADELMTQAQVFASAWALVGTRSDRGDELANAEAQKADLRRMIVAALQGNASPSTAAVTAGPCGCAAFGRHYCPEHSS